MLIPRQTFYLEGVPSIEITVILSYILFHMKPIFSETFFELFLLTSVEII